MTENLKRPLLPPPISGAGGGGKGGRGGKAPREDKNDLQARSTARIIDLISEGQIVGLVDGAKSIYFDDTPLQGQDGTYNFEGVEWVESTGTPDQGYIPGFEGTGNPVPVGAEIKKSGTGPVVRVINSPDIDAIRITLQVPMFAWMQNDGDIRRTSVELAIDVQPSGGSYTEVKTVTISGKTLSPYERSVRVDLPKGGAPWSVRVRRLTDDATESSRGHHNKTFWASYTELIDAKFTYPHSAVIGLTVDAEEFGSSIPTRSYDVKGLIVRVPSNYDPENRTYNGTWNGQFKLAWTNNPAWVFYDLATNPRYGLGEFLSDSQVDKWALYQIAQYCDQLVPSGFKDPQNNDIMEPRFVFNGVINNQEEAFRVLQAIASAFRGMSYFATGAITVVADQPRDPIKVVAPADVIGGEFTYSGTSLRVRHTVAHVVWNDPDDNYRTAVEVVEAPPEYLTRYGYREKRVIAYGCTSRGQAHRFGKWIIYSELHETETVTYQAAWDHIDIVPGDIIKVFDPSYAGVRFGGRIKSVSGNRRSVTLDAPVTLASGETYRLVVTMPDGTLAERNISNSAGTHTTVSLSTALPDTPVEGAMFGIVGTDIEPRQFRVLAIRETEEGNFEVTALLHHPDKFAHVEQGVQLPPLPYQRLPSELEPPGEITAQESMTRVNGLPQIRLTVSWVLAQDPLVRFYEAQVLVPGGSWQNHTPTRLNGFDMITEPGLHVIRVRSGGDNGKYSNWVTKEYKVAGEGDAPPKVENVGTFGGVKQITVTWAPVSFSDVDYEVWAHSSLLSGPASNIIQNATRVGVVKGTTFTHVGLNPVAERWYWVRAVTFGGTPGPFSDAAYGKTELIDDDDFVEAITDLFEDLELRAPEPVYELPGPGSPMRVDGNLVLYVPEKRLYYWDESQQEWLPLIADIEEGQVRAAHIAANTIDQTHFADNLKPIGVSNGLPDPATWDGPDTIVNEQDGGLYYLKDGEWITAVPDVDLDDILVENKHIVDGAVDALKLAANAVTSTKIATGAVLEDKLADAAVTARTIAREALNATHFAQGLNPVQVVDSLPDPATWDGSNTVVNREDDGLYYLKDGEWVANAPDVDLDAIIVENKHIVDGAVTAVKLAANAVTSAKIATGAVLEEKLADAAVTARAIAANAVSTENLQDELITAEKLVANAVTEAKLAASAVTERHLASAAVTAEKIRDEAIDATKFARNIAAPQIVSSLPVFESDPKAIALDGDRNTYATAPHDSAYDITGDIVLRARIWPSALPNFSHGIIGKSEADGTYSYQFEIHSSGALRFNWNANTLQSTASTNSLFDEHGPLWVAAAFDADDGAGGHAVRFYWSVDGQSWTQLGGDVTGAGAETIRITEVGLLIGRRQFAPHVFNGKIYEAQIYDGLGGDGMGGTLVAHFRAEDAAFDDTSFASSSTGETWTLHGNARIVTENQGKLALLQSDGKLYRYDQGQWTAAVPTTDLSGLIQTEQLVDEAITAVKLAEEAVEAAKIKAGAVLAEKLAEGAVIAGKIAANAIVTENLQDELITAQKIVANAVTGAKIAASAVTEEKLANAAVTAQKIAQGAVDASKFAQGLTPPEVKNALPTSGNFEGRLVYLTTDGKLYRYHNGSWTSAVSTADLSGLIQTEQLVDEAVTNVKIATDAIDADKIKDSAITAAKIAANAVEAGKIAANAVNSDQIAANAVITAKLANNAVNAAKIAANAVTQAKIAANAVTARQIAEGAIGATAFAADIAAPQIVSSLPTSGNKEGRLVVYQGTLYRYHDGSWTDAVPTTSLTGTITATQITDSAITTPKLNANAVTAAKIATDAIQARHILANAITAGKIAAGAVGADQIQANAIGSDQIAANAISAKQLVIGDFTNLIPNPRFEQNNTDGWHEWPSSWSTGSRTDRMPTRYSGRMNLDNENDQTAYIHDLPTVGGEKLYFAMAIASEGSSPREVNVQLVVDYYDQYGDPVSSETADHTQTSIPYSIFEHTIVVPEDATTMSLGIRRLAGGSGTGWFSNVQLRRIYGSTLIADGAITAEKVSANAINANHLAANSVTASQIAANAVTSDKVIANAIQSVHIEANAVTTAKIAANAVTANEIAANAVKAAQIDAGAVTADAIAANAIVAGKIDTGAVTADTIATNAVIAAKIQANAVTAAKIASNAVQARQIAANAVTADAIAANSVGTDHLIANSVTAGIIAAGAVGADQIAANAITTNKLAANVITARELAIGDFTNIVPNPSFTDGTAHSWSSFDSQWGWGVVEASSIADLPTAPSRFVGVMPGALTQGRTVRGGVHHVEARPGDIFYFSVDVCRVGEISSGTVRIRPSRLTRSTGAESFFTLLTINPTTSWQRYEAIWTADAAYDGIRFGLRREINTDEGTVYFTNATLRRVNDSVTIADGAIIATKIAANAINANHIAANAVTASQIAANAVTASQIAANAVTTQALAANAVTANKIAAETITGNKIAGRTIAGDKLIANTITAGEIASDAVIARHIQADAVTAVKIAAGAVTTPKLEANAVTAVKIAANAVTTQKLEANAVVAAKIASNAIEARHIVANAITAGAIAAGAVGADQIAANAITADKIAANAITASKLAIGDFINIAAGSDFESDDTCPWELNNSFQISDEQAHTGARSLRITNSGGGSRVHLLRTVEVKPGDVIYAEFYARRSPDWDGASNNSKLRFGDANNNQIRSLDFSADSISDSEWTKRSTEFVVPAGVTSIRISLNRNNSTGALWIDDISIYRQVSSVLIQDGAITAEKITANAINAGHLSSGSITADAIAANAVTAAKIAANAVTTDAIAANAVTAVQIAAETITGNEIAGRTIAGDKLIANTITAEEVATNAIIARHIQADAVTAVKIAAGAVTTPKLEANAVTAVKIAANAVTTQKLEANAVVAAKIASNAIEARHLTADSVTAGAIQAGAVGAEQIAANAITADKIAAGAVTAKKLAIGDFTNLVEDPSFLHDGAGWDLGGRSVIGVGQHPTGRALQVVPGSNFIINNNDSFPALPGDKFLLVAEVAKIGTAVGNIQIRARFANISGGHAGNTAITLDESVGTGWQRYTAEVVAPAEAATGRVDIHCANFTGGEFRVAYVGLYRMTTGELIVDGAVTAEKITANAITGSHISANAIAAVHIAAGAVNASSMLADNVVVTRHINANAITAQKINSNAIVARHIQSNAVEAGHIKANAIETGHISSGAVKADQIAANAVTADKLAANSVTASHLAIGDFSNLVINPEFADGSTDGWSDWPSPWSVVERNENAGDSAVRNAPRRFIARAPLSPSNQTATVISRLAISPGESLHVSFEAASGGGTREVNFRISRWYYRADGTEISSSGTNLDTITGTSWRVRDLTFTADSDPEVAYVRIAIRRLAGGAGSGYFTNFKVHRLTPSVLIEDGAITAEKVAANAITANKLAVNSVTAGAIAAGAVNTAALAANAVTADKIAANSITGDKIKAGSIHANLITTGDGKNLLHNPTFTFGTDGWVIARNSLTSSQVKFDIRSKTSGYSGPVYPVLQVSQTDNQSTGYVDLRSRRPEVGSNYGRVYGAPCKPGDWVEASAYISAHRCDVQLRIQFYDATGASIGYSPVKGTVSSSGNNANPELWTRVWGKHQAPANAAAFNIHLRKLATKSGNDSHMFVYKPMLCYTHANATQPTPWSNGEVVRITEGSIAANSITAENGAIKNLSIDTIKISNNAISDRAFASTSQKHSIPSDWRTMVSCTVNMKGNEARIYAYCSLWADNGAKVFGRITVDGQPVGPSEVYLIRAAGNSGQVGCPTVVMTVKITPGKRVFRFQLRNKDGGKRDCNFAALDVIGLKK